MEPADTVGTAGALMIFLVSAGVLVPAAVLLTRGKAQGGCSNAFQAVLLVDLAAMLPYFSLFFNPQWPWIPIGGIFLVVSPLVSGAILYKVRKTSVLAAVIGALAVGLVGPGIAYTAGRAAYEAYGTIADGYVKDKLGDMFGELSDRFGDPSKTPTQTDWKEIQKKCGVNPAYTYDDPYVCPRGKFYGRFVYTGAPTYSDEDRPLVYCRLPDCRGRIVKARTWVLYSDGERKVLPGLMSFPPYKAIRTNRTTH